MPETTTRTVYVVQEFYGDKDREKWFDITGRSGSYDTEVLGKIALDAFKDEVPQIQFRLVKRTITEEVLSD